MLGDASIFAKSKTSEDRCARSGGGAQSRRPFHLHCFPLTCLSPPAGRPVVPRRPVFLLASFLTGTLQGNAVPTTRRVSTTFSRTRDSNLGAIGDSGETRRPQKQQQMMVLPLCVRAAQIIPENSLHRASLETANDSCYNVRVVFSLSSQNGRDSCSAADVLCLTVLTMTGCGRRKSQRREVVLPEDLLCQTRCPTHPPH